ncbi:hypothetical protein HGM15179_001071 [Zosterops borbonicus]|uniref:Uncharacterized protein n=1 Tax=Zosterops borbonicus TaxID=364589 RepID=A0A8K1GX11_9PASS|nr:hypothetical protein HGM15179_001070 [Zosterops borbonicus]TRZ25948.1 hypothetical protein HGM15179_001071 [Zosterops borbonicus]
MGNRIMEYAQLEETPRIIKIQLLALHKTIPKSHTTLPESIVQMFLGLCWAWCCDCFPGELDPVLNHPLGEKPFPDIQLKSLLTQLCAICTSPVAGYQREQIE